MFNDKIQPMNSQFLLYQDDNGVTNVNVRFDGQDVWLSQQQIALLFDTTHENIVQHIRNIYQGAELQEERGCVKMTSSCHFLLTGNEKGGLLRLKIRFR